MKRTALFLAIGELLNDMQRKIAAAVGVNCSTICRINRSKTWRHVA